MLFPIKWCPFFNAGKKTLAQLLGASKFCSWASEISLSSPVSLNEDIRFRNDWLKAWIS